MSRQFWSETLVWATADGATVTNTSAITIIFPNVTIPANFMQDGRGLRITADGHYAATGSATLIFYVIWGGTGGTIIAQTPAIVTNGTIGTANAATGAPWNLDCRVQTRSNGSSGSLFGTGHATIHTGVAPTQGTVANYGCTVSMNSTGLLTPAVVGSLDLTSDTALTLACKFSAASTSNALIGHTYHIEALN